MPYYSRDPKRDHNFDNHPYNRALGPNYYNVNGIWALKPWYLGPWTLKSKLFEGGYTGEYIGKYYKVFLGGILGV